MGGNSKMRNLLTYFPIEPTRAYPIPGLLTAMLTTLKQIGICTLMQNLHICFTNEPTTFEGNLFKTGNSSMHFTPQKGIVSGKSSPQSENCSS